MSSYESSMKITDELERHVAQQQLDDLPPTVAVMVVVQLLVAVLLIIVSTLLWAHDVAAKEQTLGDHPAVIVFKKWNQSDYASRTAVYPHPATIWWYMQNPKAPDHPLPEAHP